MHIPIVGYLDRFSVLPGGNIEVKVSSTRSEPYEVRLVRIRSADPNPAGPGMKIEDLGHIFSRKLPSRFQDVTLGSYARVPHDARLAPGGESFTWTVLVHPTLLPQSPIAVMAKGDPAARGLRLDVSRDGVEATVATEGAAPLRVATGVPLRRAVWYRLWLACDASTGRIAVGQAPLVPAPLFDRPAFAESRADRSLLPDSNADLLFAAAERHGAHVDHFDGRLEAPAVLRRFAESDPSAAPRVAEAIATWDFSVGIDGRHVHDRGPHGLHGTLVNMPTRGVRGAHWTGRETCWRHAPADYAAVHFHGDDIEDCGWETDFVFTAPADLRSGVYGFQLTCGDASDTIPFYVRPPRGDGVRPPARAVSPNVSASSGGSDPIAPVLFIAPTFTYQAYANHRRGNFDAPFKARAKAWGAYPRNPDEHPDFGTSTYNRHPDDTGICYSTRLRPILTVRPGYLTFNDAKGSGVRHFTGDSHLTDWLEQKSIAYDVVTDEDVDNEGAALLTPYRAVLTGSHPEYHTARTLDAIQAYKAQGGRLVYLGGNGFYWRIARNPALPHMIEIRRAEGGIRAWAAEPGEYYHSLDGALGGMWRRSMRPPQSIGGVGFSAQGYFEGSYYRRMPASYAPEHAWMFAGIDGEIIGDFGLSGGGAAGFELDRADQSLGTPPNAVILARSEKHQAHFVPVHEEMLSQVLTISGETPESLIRAEIVYFDLPNGGAVFAVGSITFCGSLSHNNYDNNISRLLENVLRRFIGD